MYFENIEHKIRHSEQILANAITDLKTTISELVAELKNDNNNN